MVLSSSVICSQFVAVADLLAFEVRIVRTSRTSPESEFVGPLVRVRPCGFGVTGIRLVRVPRIFVSLYVQVQRIGSQIFRSGVVRGSNISNRMRENIRNRATLSPKMLQTRSKLCGTLISALKGKFASSRRLVRPGVVRAFSSCLNNGMCVYHPITRTRTAVCQGPSLLFSSYLFRVFVLPLKISCY